MEDLEDLRARIARFVREREWECFHSPKNLSMALSVEVAELVEHFQWLTQKQSLNLAPDAREEVGEEIADVLIYLLCLAEALGIDPIAEARKKVEKNRAKYPVESMKGKAP